MKNRRSLLSFFCASAALGAGLARPLSGFSQDAPRRAPTEAMPEELVFALRFGWLGRSDVQEFISDVAWRHDMPRRWIEDQFRPLGVQPRALALVNPPPPSADEPARKRSWARYLSAHVDASRVREGREFLSQHRRTFSNVSKHYGIPAHVIAAIIGVETKYGKFTGRYPALETLVTLAFASPRRNDFFKSELESLLIMGREGVIDLQRTQGSFAGALGLPQFMPSSWRNFAVGYDSNRPNLLNNPSDAIASVANFLRVHGWQPNEPSHTPALMPAKFDANRFLPTRLSPAHTLAQLTSAGIRQEVERFSPDARVSLIDLPEADDTVIYWIAAQNFFTITHYNRSYMYAAAVLTLAERLSAASPT